MDSDSDLDVIIFHFENRLKQISSYSAEKFPQTQPPKPIHKSIPIARIANNNEQIYFHFKKFSLLSIRICGK